MSRSTYRWLIVGVILAVVVLLLVVGMLLYRPTRVPDVRLKPLAEATALIEEAGLRLGVASKVATQSTGEGLVIEQTPRAGSSASRRTDVDLLVAERPMPVKVPELIGKDAAFAEETLSALLFLPTRIDVFDVEGAEGSVVTQLPVAGTLWTTGRRVAFAVAAGPDDGTGIAVPSLIGRGLDAALDEAEAAGLAPIAVVRDINDAENNEVVEQLPPAGAVVKPGTTMLLYLELP